MYSLDSLFNPRSIAIIGASSNLQRAGYIVTNNILSGGYNGIVLPVSLKYRSVCGVLAYKSIDELPLSPELAVLCTKRELNTKILTQLAERGTKCAIVLESDLSEQLKQDQFYTTLAEQLNIRIIGPNSLGIILPWISLNASFSPISAIPGKIAFISQSAAVCTSVLDWAWEKNIGFSSFISIGHAQDIDFAELLDRLALDSKTESILLYVDHIEDARRFISAARATSRNKRILVLKGGQSKAGRVAAQWHSQGKESLDIVYDSAIRRSGMLRVQNNHELFAAVETLTHSIPLRGERIAIVTNGGGPAVLATDTLSLRGGKLAELSETTLNKLTEAVGHNVPISCPIDIGGDACIQRYSRCIDILLDSEELDAILVMYSPSAIAAPKATASAVIESFKSNPKHRKFNLLTNWAGETSAKEARLLFTSAGIPTYRTPESAAIAYMHLVEYRRNQKQLRETPVSTEKVDSAQQTLANQHINDCLSDDLLELESYQSNPIFHAYGLNVLPTHIAHDAAEAAHIANELSYPVALKLCSHDIAHKSDVHGVMLNLRTASEVSDAAHAIMVRAKTAFPSSHLLGLTVQPMADLSNSLELRIKVKSDPTFGPVILLGQGGSEWDEDTDAAAALPPLNMTLARYLIVRAIKDKNIRVQTLPVPINIQALSEVLVRISQLIVDQPLIDELDIHPLLLSGDNVTIIDANISLITESDINPNRLAIKPYPTEYEQEVELKNGETVLLRPILPEDEPHHAEFMRKVSKEDLYKRFFSDIGEINHEMLANFTQIDFDREIAFVAVRHSGTSSEIIGVSRGLINPQKTDAEFAILIRSDLKGVGLGKILMNKLIQYCENKGTKQISGMTMPTNTGMLTLAKHLGFKINIDFEDGTADMVLALS
ncbi:bifunctional acetate--CoA ligase family protein/GNAT family N-acetyltransferase [Vibrio maerlii]|uniref:bifunctional acetate--CoA ligase family protein/GNAT family N-acetyltransferase n=1 Tax=Vibrio maerlii TaxID=2231648 RepID=UPI000E3E6BD5|nr:bifunctional acetate--CoA ligase family protein/GNAT family N-acetyltransferase [Vibrio maerlii]